MQHFVLSLNGSKYSFQYTFKVIHVLVTLENGKSLVKMSTQKISCPSYHDAYTNRNNQKVYNILWCKMRFEVTFHPKQIHMCPKYRRASKNGMSMPQQAKVLQSLDLALHCSAPYMLIENKHCVNGELLIATIEDFCTHENILDIWVNAMHAI